VTARRGASMGDLARSLGLVLGLVVVTALLIQHRHNHRVKVVDTRPAIAEARRIAPYAVLAPVGLSSRWRATSVRLSGPVPQHPAPTHLHIGYVSPAEHYVALEESDATDTSFVAAETAHGREVGSRQIAGRQWSEYDATGSTRALVLRSGGTAVVLVGETSWTELSELAASLA
jgi:uncharacterized protein DUF4245